MIGEIGKVTRVDVDGGIWCTIERLTGPGEEHGPLRPLLPPGAVGTAGATTVTTSSTESHTHTVDVRPLQAGDFIVVLPVAGVADGWVVLGRIG